MKVIFSGLEDSGKSYKLAQASIALVYRNAKWAKMGLKPREIVSVLPYKVPFLEWAAELGVPIVDWSQSRTVIEDLEDLAHVDLILDEVGTYFDVRTFKDLPLSTRLWLAQASKLGVDIYGGAQDFAQVDLAFRRLTNELYEITKLIGSPRPDITRPVVDTVWGVCMMRQLDPKGYDEQKKKFASSGFPQFFFLQKKICEVFDTNKRVPKGVFPPYKHIERRCIIPNCRMERHVVREGQHYQITHA